MSNQNLRAAQDQVQRFIEVGQHEDAIRLLLKIINYVSADGKIILNGNHDNTFVARCLFDCYSYIKSGTDSSLMSLLDTLIVQLSTLSDDNFDLKRYLLYKRHIGAFALNDIKTMRTTFEYVIHYLCFLII